MKLSAFLQDTALSAAVVVAGARSIDREVTWVHIVDYPGIADWVRPGQLLLSTGYNWPQDETAERELIETLNRKKLAGVVLAVPRFLPHFPPATIRTAEQCGLPLLEIPWEVPFSKITEEIHFRIISHQAQVIERSERIHRAFTQAALAASSLIDLAEALAKQLGRACAFTDADGRSLAVAGVLDRRPPLEQTVAGRIGQTGVLRQIRESEGPLRLTPIDDPALPGGLACPVRIHGELEGIVWMSEEDSPIGELDIRAIEHAAVIAALHLSHQRELSQQEARLGHAFVDTLLEGRFDASPASLERAKLRGWDPDARYRVCLILLDEPIPLSREGFLRRERWTERLEQQLISVGLSPLVTVSLNQVTFLLPERVAPQKIWKAVGDPACSMAVSRVCQGGRGIATGGRDVAALVPLLKPGRIHDFDEIMFPRVLSGDAEARDLFLVRLIGPLHRQRRGQVLVETLCTLAEEGFQLVETARQLGIHISTLRYRVDRIQTLLELPLNDPEVRLQLQVAVRLYRLSQT